MICNVTQGRKGGAEYYMQIDRKYDRPMQRQLREMVAIEMDRGDMIINSKNEYMSARVPRLVI